MLTWSFPLWFLQFIILGGIVLCVAGASALIVFLFIDSRDNQIW